MVRGLVVLGGSSHPQLTETICNHLGVPPAKALLSKFAGGETHIEIGESVREKDVFIIQSGGGKVNDHLMEMLIMVSACKMASARRVTVVLPIFPYSRQPGIPYNKLGAPLAKAPTLQTEPQKAKEEQHGVNGAPQTPGPGHHGGQKHGQGANGLHKSFSKMQMDGDLDNGVAVPRRKDTLDSVKSDKADKDYSASSNSRTHQPLHRHDFTSSSSSSSSTNGVDASAASPQSSQPPPFEPQRGYKQWVAQAGTLVADLVTCAGADHVITMDLHDPQYQGFFDIPVDNLYGRHLLRKYIQFQIPNYQQAVIVSPDAGGAKRATAIADQLGMPFALIHRERRPTQITERQNSTMMLVGDIAQRVAILVDDLADTSNTIVRAARLLKKEGATRVYALVTHGVLSGDAIERINASALDRVVVTNTIDQARNLARCPKLEVLEVGQVFAEAIRRVHHGESISVLFNYE